MDDSPRDSDVRFEQVIDQLRPIWLGPIHRPVVGEPTPPEQMDEMESLLVLQEALDHIDPVERYEGFVGAMVDGACTLRRVDLPAAGCIEYCYEFARDEQLAYLCITQLATGRRTSMGVPPEALEPPSSAA